MKFPVAVVLSLTTGRCLCSPHDIHKFIEHVAGHQVWIHEMAERTLWEKLSARVFAQHPSLRDVAEFTPPTDKAEVEAYCRTFVSKEVDRLGVDVLDVAMGMDARTESPVDSMRRMVPDKEIFVATVPEANR